MGPLLGCVSVPLYDGDPLLGRCRTCGIVQDKDVSFACRVYSVYRPACIVCSF